MNKRLISITLALIALLFVSLACSISGDSEFNDKESAVEEVEKPAKPDPTAAPTLEPTPEPTTPPTLSPEPETEDSSTMTTAGDGMEMVLIPAGEFVMGTTSEEVDRIMTDCANTGGTCKAEWYTNETPQHTIYLDAYSIDITPVTNAMFVEFLNAQGNQEEGGITWIETEDADGHIQQSGDSWVVDDGYTDHPVVEVSWYGAQAYCEWTGRRLPTEAEWEKAARGVDGQIYPWGSLELAGNLLNFADSNNELLPWSDPTIDDGYERTSPVGSYPDGASPFGVLDMAGNVWEWMADWYGEDYYSDSPSENPIGPSSGDVRVVRGGSWSNNNRDVRSSDRHRAAPVDANNNLGFRCVSIP